MSLLNSLSGMLGSEAGNALTGLLDKVGGLEGLTSRFSQEGMGDVVQSWIAKGQNLPINAEQIEKVLGAGPLADIAARLGVNPSDAAQQISGFLPDMIDKLTPDGKLPQGGIGDLISGIGGLLKR